VSNCQCKGVDGQHVSVSV